MKKAFTFKRIILALSTVLILAGIGFLSLLSYDSSKRNKWDDFEKFTTSDDKYSIILKSYFPDFGGGNVSSIKIICKDEVNQKEKEYTQFKYIYPREYNGTKLFEFNEIDGKKSKLTVTLYTGEKETYTFIWSDIFS